MIDFPNWNPRQITLNKIYSLDQKTSIKSLRSSSSAFIKNKIVREYIFNRDNNQCVLCGERESLQIDHIVSVYQASKDRELIHKLNTRENLRLLCGTCNKSRSPNGDNDG